MPRTIKFLTLLLAFLLMHGCAHVKVYDIEQIATGGSIMRATASTWSEPAGTAARRATQDATKYCQHEGREVKIKALKTQPGNSSVTEVAEAEFDCVSSTPTRSSHS